MTDDANPGFNVGLRAHPAREGIETDNFANALGLFSSSQDDFDLWFKRRLADSTRVDLNTSPEMSLPELLSSYSAAASA